MTNGELDRIAIENDAKQGERMLAELHKFIGQFVSYPSSHARIAHALWVVHTHLMDRWESTPRLAFLSPEPASGKTRAMEITEMLVPNPVMSVNVSPAYLFRKVGSDEPATILYDEIDTVFGPKAKENEEIRGLLNAGHRRGATVGRCVVHGKTIETEETPAYSAVALAGLGWLPDTILSRSVIVRMRRRRAGEVIEPFRRRFVLPAATTVREHIEQWARSAEIKIPDLPHEIQDRDADVWEPLIAIADAVGGDWPINARNAAVALVTDSKEREPSLGIRLLADLRLIFGQSDKMLTKEIIAGLIGLDESPWGDLKGKSLDERSLAHRLRPYGIKSVRIRVGESVARGYTRPDLVDAWARYLPPSSENNATSATPATNTANNGNDVALVADVAHSSGHGGDPEHEHRGLPEAADNPGRDDLDLPEILDRRPRCVQCGGKTGGLVEADGGSGPVLLHRDCIKAWQTSL